MDFKAGDVVTLKSGGPRMTVDFVDAGGSRPPVMCSWFEDKKRCQDRFYAETLRKQGDVVAVAGGTTSMASDW